MAKRKLFLYLASAGGYIGIGMLLGYALGDHTTNTGLWLGILLVILGAVLLGMFISARSEPSEPTEPPRSSSGNISDVPPET